MNDLNRLFCVLYFLVQEVFAFNVCIWECEFRWEPGRQLATGDGWRRYIVNKACGLTQALVSCGISMSILLGKRCLAILEVLTIALSSREGFGVLCSLAL